VCICPDALIKDGTFINARVPKFIKDYLKRGKELESTVVHHWEYGVDLELIPATDPFNGCRFEVFEFNAAGVTFEGRQKTLSRMFDLASSGEEIDVLCAREPSNKYDPNAIALFWQENGNKNQIGYVPKRDAASIVELLSSGGGLVSMDFLEMGEMANGTVWVKLQIVISLNGEK